MIHRGPDGQFHSDGDDPHPNPNLENSVRKKFFENHPGIKDGTITTKDAPIGLSSEYFDIYDYVLNTDTRTATWMKRGFSNKKPGTVLNYIAFLKTLCYHYKFSEIDKATKEDLLKPETEITKRILVKGDETLTRKNALREVQEYIDWKREMDFADNTILSRFGLLIYYIKALDLCNLGAPREVKKEIKGVPRRMEQAKDIAISKEYARLVLGHCQYWHKRRLLAMLSSGLNPIDLVSLRVRNVKLEERKNEDDPVRIEAIRAKTGAYIDSFFSAEWSGLTIFDTVFRREGS